MESLLARGDDIDKEEAAAVLLDALRSSEERARFSEEELEAMKQRVQAGQEAGDITGAHSATPQPAQQPATSNAAPAVPHGAQHQYYPVPQQPPPVVLPVIPP